MLKVAIRIPPRNHAGRSQSSACRFGSVGTKAAMSTDPAESPETECLREGLKRVAVALKEAELPFALAVAMPHG